MIPLRQRLASVVLLAVAAAACASGPSLVATVGTDVEITTDDVAALYSTSEIALDDQFRWSVFNLIAREVLLTAARTDLGVELYATVVDQLYQDMILERDAQGLTTADWLGVPNAGDGMLLFNAQVAVLRDVVVRALAIDPEYLDALFADPAGITTVCVQHILSETEVEAEDVKVQLLAGADFATLADAVSQDTSPGGDLGCRTADGYVAEFAAASLEAPLNVPFGPVETQFGYHILIVSERTAPTREEVAADPVQFLSGTEANTLWADWVSAGLEAAVVTVEPKYGTWSPLGIIPPTEPSETG